MKNSYEIDKMKLYCFKFTQIGQIVKMTRIKQEIYNEI